MSALDAAIRKLRWQASPASEDVVLTRSQAAAALAEIEGRDRPAGFRLFEVTMGVYLPVDAPLPHDLRGWLERATGADLADVSAVPTILERVVEKRYPPSEDVVRMRRRDGIKGPY